MAGYQDHPDEPTTMTNVFVDCSMPMRASGFLRIGDAEQKDRSGYVEIMVVPGELATLRIMATGRQARAAREHMQGDEGIIRMAETHAAIRGADQDISITRMTYSPGGVVSIPPPYIRRQMAQELEEASRASEYPTQEDET